MRRRVVAAAGAAVCMIAIVPVSAAMAADANGCSGSVQSFTATGDPLDSATAPGDGATAGDPLVIDPQGSIAWEGSTDAPITTGSWSVSIGGVPFRSGDVDNADGQTSGSGTVDLAGAPAPVQWVLTSNARIPVEGSMSGSGGTCTASGYLAGTGGSPITSPIFLAGAGLAALGAVGVIAMAVGTKATVVAASTATPPAGGAS